MTPQPELSIPDKWRAIDYLATNGLPQDRYDLFLDAMAKRPPPVGPVFPEMIVANRWLETHMLPAGDYQLFRQHMENGAQHLRARLSSVPFYAKRAKAEAERSGDEMEYWRDLFGSQINILPPPAKSSTPGARLTPAEFQDLVQDDLQAKAQIQQLLASQA